MNNNLVDRLPQWPRVIVKLISAIAIIVGIVIILGWTFYYWLPEYVWPFLVSVKPNTAICFILTGISLWISCERKTKYARFLAEISAAIVIVISFLTLFEYFFINIDLGIDQGIFKEPLTNVWDFPPPGRMPPFVAVNFALIGVTLFLLRNKVISYRVRQIFISIVLFTSFFEFLGHIYQIDNMTAIFGAADKYTQLALPTSIICILLGIGILLARPRHGIISILISRDSGGVLARRLILPAFILPIILGYIGLVGLAEKWVGFREAMFGTSLLVMGAIFFFSALILVNAYLINRAEVDRKRAEQALKLNQIKLQSILDHTSAVIYIYDLEGKCLLINKQFEKLFHKSASEVIGKSAHAVLSPDISEKFVENNLKVIESRLPIAVEEIIPSKDSVSTYLSNKFPLFDDQGIPYAVAGISTDITEIKRMHELLRESEERFSLALQSAEAGTWSWDIPKNVVVWDDYMYFLFGLKPGSFSQQYEAAIHLIHPDDRKRMIEEVRQILDKGTEYETECRIIHTDGSIHYIGARGKVHRDRFGNPMRMAGVCLDVTRRKQSEEELRHAKEIAERLAEKAEEASRAKSAFLAAMSHEIRTPLNGVIGMTGLLLDTTLSSEQRDYVKTIRISGEALLSVINDILDFSKIESGRMELEDVDFNLHSLVDDSVEIVAAHVHNKGIAIGANIDSKVPEWLTGDSSRVRQVLSNLLSNAAKFTEKGEIGVSVRLHSREKKKVTLLFEVVDTGIGITADVKQHLFQPFYQGDMSTSRKYGGSGLGLAICKRLIEIMGGEIDVDSVPGRGCRFWFTVNLVECINPLPKFEYKLFPELEGVRILSVDDNAINREIVKKQAELWKFRCDVASNAAEGLSLMKRAVNENDPYALSIIDYIMSGMNGFELIQIMRQLKEIAHTPVIILSSLGTSFGLHELQQLGISMSLSKPIRPAKLYESIITVLKDMEGKAGTIVAQAHDQVVQKKKKARILLAEDNPINQQVALLILAKLGYRADTVANGLEVLSAIEKVPYDLILMDCQMPEMDGYTTTEHIRKLEKINGLGNRIAIIAMTAHALKGDREKCLESGMSDYISKPIDIKFLAEILEKWLDQKNIVIDLEQYPEKKVQQQGDIMSLIDIDRLHSIFGNDPATIYEFIKSFIKSTSELLKDIKAAVANKNMQLAKELFHRLKGSSGNSGIMVLHTLSRNAEEKVLESEWTVVEKIVGEIDDMFEKLRVEVEDKFAV
jgi:PAS domain S-box-containing protein